LIDEGEVVGLGEGARLPFVMDGVVMRGDQRGRQLGFPTANLAPPTDRPLPPNGVYAGRVTLDRFPGRWVGAVNIGVRPQFETALGLLVEVHLLDFNGDLYDSRLHLELVAWLRDERRFDSVEALVEQIDKDLKACRQAVML
jgi:riboflavin kinase / FMN adenylyltransferase